MMAQLGAWLFAAALIWIVIAATWKLLVILAALTALLWIGSKILGWIAAGIQDAQRRNLALIHRADQQHELIMHGDEIGGTYGDYLPPAGLR